MSDSDNKKDGLSPENQEVWDNFVDEPEESPARQQEDFKILLDTFDLEEKTSETTTGNKESRINSISLKVKKVLQEPQLDRRTEEKLRKGKMPIEARIDLHGMTREVAHEALEKFIKESYDRGLRNVLVITGKGKSKSTSEDWLVVGDGILKTSVPFWLDGVVLKPYILKYMNAQPKDGGTGALYVYLKRKR